MGWASLREAMRGMNVIGDQTHGKYNFGTTLIAVIAVIIAAMTANRACAQPSLEEQAAAETIQIENDIKSGLVPTIIAGEAADIEREGNWKDFMFEFKRDVLMGLGLAIKSMAMGLAVVATYCLALLGRAVIWHLFPQPVAREHRPVVIPAANPSRPGADRPSAPAGPPAPRGPSAPNGPTRPVGQPRPAAPVAPEWPTAPAGQPAPQSRPAYDWWRDAEYRAWRRHEARAAELADNTRRLGQPGSPVVSANGHGPAR